MVLTFEYVGHNKIVTKENGSRVKGETIDHMMYDCYLTEAQRVIRPDIQLIPSAFYNFLSSPRESVNNIGYSRAKWDKELAPRVTPMINEALMPFQRAAVYCMVKTGRCMNAADMGLGKSLQGLSALLCKRNKNKGDLILCPGALRRNWVAEIQKWIGDDIPVHLIDKGGKNHQENSIKTMLFAPGIKIVSYDMAATFFKALTPAARRRPYFNTVLCDESHCLKESTTKRYVNLSEPIKYAENVFLLSGTPAPNRNVELFTQFSLLRPMVFTNKRSFTDRYCNGHRDNFGRYDDRGASNMKELAYMTSKMVIRMRREDFLQELPAVTRQRVILSPRSRPASFRKQMVQFAQQLRIAETDERATQKLQQLASAMFRETAVIKEKPVMEYMDTFCDTNREKTVLFCIHHTMFDAMSTHLTERGEGFIGISGKTPMKERMDLIHKFLNDDSILYALCTLGSCSTGLNFTPAPQMVFLELSWDLSAMLQAQCRINRIGGASKLSYTYLLCDETLDERVFKKILSKNQNTIQVLEGGKDYGDLHFDQEDDTSFKRKREDYEQISPDKKRKK